MRVIWPCLVFFAMSLLAEGNDSAMEPLGNGGTAHINMANIQVRAEDEIRVDKSLPSTDGSKSKYHQNKKFHGKYYLWQSQFQTYPMGMDGEPEKFAQRIRQALPKLNALRLPFNEHSFVDGALHEQYERFLIAAADQGFELLFVYAGGGAQMMGNAKFPGFDNMTQEEGKVALNQNFSDIENAWDHMLNWLEDHSKVANATWGFELINEPAAYRRLARKRQPAIGDFMGLYVEHCAQLAKRILARMDREILVGVWGYSGDIHSLTRNQYKGKLAIDYLRESVGDRLIWSVHLYPGWAGTKKVTSRQGLRNQLNSHFRPLGQDRVLITETNIRGPVSNAKSPRNSVDFFAEDFEWFAEHDIGLAWFPGFEAGASNLLVVDRGRGLRMLHQHSLAHAMNAWSLDENMKIEQQVGARLRNEAYEVKNGEAKFDQAKGAFFAFGNNADNVLTVADDNNGFLYGGQGADQLNDGAGDDFLFGQYGDDVLQSNGGVNHLWGGDGDDELIGGGRFAQLHGGAGRDVFVANAETTVIVDFTSGEDRLETRGDWQAIDYDQEGVMNDARCQCPMGSVIVLNTPASLF